MTSLQNDTTTPQSPVSVIKMEQYSVVLSVTTLCLTMIFGSGGSLIIIMSLCINKLHRKIRYILLTLLLTVSTLFDLIYCPMEMYHLIVESNLEGQSSTLKFAGPSVFLCLLTAMTCVLIIISIYNLCVLTEKFKCIYRYVLCAFCVTLSLGLMLGPATGYGILSKNEEELAEFQSFHILNDKSFIFRVVLYSLWITLAFIVLVGMVSFIAMTRRAVQEQEIDQVSMYSEPHSPEGLNIPTLLIKGTDDGSENEDDQLKPLDTKTTTVPAKNSHHLLSTQDSHSNKEDNTSTVGDLPSPSRNKNHHLGVNMAAYLGRRRHTIGQIGTTGLDVLEKARQYNYVRKFSVDIQALQAQLENPKIHGSNFPFRSDTELQKTGQNEDKNDVLKEPKPSTLQCQNTEGCDEQDEKEQPSNDKMNSQEADNKDPPYNVHDSSHETLTPPIITLSETTADECHDNNTEPQIDKSSSFIKLSCFLVITFISCLLPVFITESVRYHLSRTAYVNIVTCTMALSIVQTIIYPHIIFCMDNLIHTSTHKLFSNLHRQVMQMCYDRQEVPTSEPADINVTQV